MAIPSYRFVVSGRVQGVYFRQSTLAQAQALGLRGWVRNLADGRVEGLAGGDDPDALVALRQWLQRGPQAARVDTLEWQPDDSGYDGDGFDIRR